MKPGYFLVFMICVSAVAGVAGVSMVSNRSMASYGQIAVLGVQTYYDFACTKVFSSINWGTICPDSSTTATMYVKNLSNVAITLSLSVVSWDPVVASQYISVTWDAQGKVLIVGQSIQVILTCAVKKDVTGIVTFNNVINIIGTGIV